MDLSRRFFLAGAGAFGAFGAFSGSRLLRAASVPAGVAKLKFGVVSDVHVRLATPGGLAVSHNTDTLVHTLEWFRDQGVDAVMIAGDIADHGMVGEMEAVAKAWFQVFPDDKAPDGRTVARLFVTGNHDWEGFEYGGNIKGQYKGDDDAWRQAILRTDYKGNWERIWHEPFAPVWMKNVKGYNFIGAHWTADHCRGADEIGILGVEEFFAAHGKELDPNQPFFYFQHPHPKDTVYGAKAWGRDLGASTRALTPFANAVAFSGHSHFTLTDERSVWQGAFTSIGTASLRYTSNYDAGTEGGYENRKRDSLMAKLNTFDNRQGMLVSVFDDRLAITRRDFMRDAALGDNWVLPLPVAENRPFAFKTRAPIYGVPAFPAAAEAAVAETTVGKNKKPALKVSFPAATAGKVRAHDYVVEFTAADGAAKRFNMLAPGFHRARTDGEATAAVAFVVARAKLPAAFAVARVTVTPRSCYGVAGTPLTAQI